MPYGRLPEKFAAAIQVLVARSCGPPCTGGVAGSQYDVPSVGSRNEGVVGMLFLSRICPKLSYVRYQYVVERTPAVISAAHLRLSFEIIHFGKGRSAGGLISPGFLLLFLLCRIVARSSGGLPADSVEGRPAG